MRIKYNVVKYKLKISTDTGIHEYEISADVKKKELKKFIKEKVSNQLENYKNVYQAELIPIMEHTILIKNGIILERL